MVRLVVMHTGYVAVTRPDAARDTIVPAGPNFPGLSDALEGIAAAGASGLLLRSVGVPLAGTIAPVRIFLIMIGAVSSRIRAGAHPLRLSAAPGFLLLACAAMVTALIR